MCTNCGREACEECFEIISKLTDPSTQTANAPPRTQKEKQALLNPFFLSCARKIEHGVNTFVPVTRFEKPELDAAVAEMERLTIYELTQASKSNEAQRAECVRRCITMDNGSPSPRSLANGAVSSESSGTLDISRPFDEESYNDGICILIKDPVPTQASKHLTVTAPLIPTYPIPRYTVSTLKEDVFIRQWANGIPLVVSGLHDHLQVRWTPEYFMSKYGGQQCIILECQNDSNKKVTVEEFFREFGRYEGRTECWKLKVCPLSFLCW